MPTIELKNEVPRDAAAVPCPCGGYADRVDCTEDEVKQYNCGRNRPCCSRAFVCRACKSRLVGQAKAPEMRD